MNGVVKFFKADRGFGFIQGEDNKDYFIHQSNVLMNGFRYLEPGQSVEFDPEAGIDGKGPQAINVVPDQPPKSFRDSVITKEGA